MTSGIHCTKAILVHPPWDLVNFEKKFFSTKSSYRHETFCECPKNYNESPECIGVRINWSHLNGVCSKLGPIVTPTEPIYRDSISKFWNKLSCVVVHSHSLLPQGGASDGLEQ